MAVSGSNQETRPYNTVRRFLMSAEIDMQSDVFILKPLNFCQELEFIPILKRGETFEKIF